MTTFKLIYTAISLLLIVTVLSQSKGNGLSATFGGTGEFYAQKRGAEKVLFNITLILAVIFIGMSVSFYFI